LRLAATSDTICRRVAQKLQGDFAKTAVVENKTGAGGQIAVQTVKAAAPDGANILQTPTSILTIYPHIYKKLAYEPLVDLTPVTLVACSTLAWRLAPPCR
jgi:tripartite-type tricarboxylate transporter receptor subunit TctC